MTRFALAGLAVAVVASTLPAADDDAVRIKYTTTFKIKPGPKTECYTIDTGIPKNIPGRQKIVSLKYSFEPSRTYDDDGDTVAEFVVEDPTSLKEIVLTVELDLFRYDLSVAKAEKKYRSFSSKETQKLWTLPEDHLEADDPAIEAAAEGLVGKTDSETVDKTMAFVCKHLKSDPKLEKNHGALWALQNKRGVCSEYADLFVALLRANKVPARVRCGYYLTEDFEPNRAPLHAWAEVYYQEYGWVPFEPYHVDLGDTTPDKMKNRYLYIGQHRRAEAFFGHRGFVLQYRGDTPSIYEEYKPIARKPLGN